VKYVIVLLIVIAALAWWLNRRGSSGLGSNGSVDSVPGALGQQAHRNDTHGGAGGL